MGKRIKLYLLLGLFESTTGLIDGLDAAAQLKIELALATANQAQDPQYEIGLDDTAYPQWTLDHMQNAGIDISGLEKAITNSNDVSF